MYTVKKIPYSETWPLRHEVMWPNETIDYVKLPNDENGIHYGLFIEGKLISALSLFIQDQEAQFRKFATKVDKQGKGYGTTLLTHLMEQSESLDIQRIWCNARTDKASFYHRFGLKETTHSFVKNGQSYVVMEKRL